MEPKKTIFFLNLVSFGHAPRTLAPYIDMKNFTFKIWLCQTAAALLCGAAVFAEEISAEKTSAPLFGWNLLWSGSWVGSESKTWNGTLHNRLDLNLSLLPLNLTLRGQVLDRRPFNFDLDSMWGNPDKVITHFTGGLYHTSTGSRLLYGVLDEWGLPARIRNPWIRSPPYAENHEKIRVDIKTVPSSTKEDEAYLHLSTPYLEIFPDVKLKSFISGQANAGALTQTDLTVNAITALPAFSGGLDFTFGKKSVLLLEGFYTEQILPPVKASGWFSNPPPLPEREFYLCSAGLLFANQNFSVSSDFAYSDTFAWGEDIYANLGVSISPPLPFGKRERPLLISLAADGAGERFIYRDGVNHGKNFRGAGRIDWRGKFNSLTRLSTTLRGPAPGGDFNRSSTNFYYRAPSSVTANKTKSVWLSRISIYADRNAVNPRKINDSYSGTVGISVNLRHFGVNTPLNINLSGSFKGTTEEELAPNPYPIPNELWSWESASIKCEFVWSNKRFQVRSGIGYVNYAKKNGKIDFSVSSSIRFNQGRLSFKTGTADFPEKWNWSISWRKEIQGKH